MGIGLPLPRSVTESGAARRGGLLPSLVTVPGGVPGAVEGYMCHGVLSGDWEACLCTCICGSVLVCGQASGCWYVCQWVCTWGSGVGGLGLSTSQVYQVFGF